MEGLEAWEKLIFIKDGKNLGVLGADSGCPMKWGHGRREDFEPRISQIYTDQRESWGFGF